MRETETLYNIAEDFKDNYSLLQNPSTMISGDRSKPFFCLCVWLAYILEWNAILGGKYLQIRRAKISYMALNRNSLKQICPFCLNIPTKQIRKKKKGERRVQFICDLDHDMIP